MATTTVEDFHLSRYEDSYVSYKVYNPRVYKTILIGFAPFYINTGLSALCFYYLINMDILRTWYQPLVFVILYYLAIVTAAKSLPSVTDMQGIFDEMKRQATSIRLLILIFLGPIYLIITIPAYLIATVRMKSSNIYYAIGITYALFVFVVSILPFFGVEVAIFDPIIRRLQSWIKKIIMIVSDT